MRDTLVVLILFPFLLFFAIPVSAVEKEERKFQDEIIYFIMVDRFNNADSSNDFKVNAADQKAYNGGDFKGITGKLDYISDMGFTAIWLTPVFDNEEKGYHGYWINDFYETEEHFGTIEEFKTLVKEAHKRDMKVILDFVVNHVGPKHPWVNDEAKLDWFHEEQPIINWDNQQEVENNWLFDLPDLNQENPETRKYLLDAAKWWIQETNVDGYRLDTVKHVPKDFWSDFSSEVKSVKDDFYLLGEVWHNDLRVVASYEETGIDSFVDFSQNEHLRTTFSKPNQSLDWLFTSLERNMAFFRQPELLGNFMDNHDMIRFTRDSIQNKQDPVTRWKLALTYLYTAPGIPIVYYGSEIALDGGEDPDNRRLMDFDADNELINYLTKLGELRQQYPALSRGELEVLHEEAGMAVYKRSYKDEQLIVAINNTTKSQTVIIDNKDLPLNKELTVLLAGIVVSESDGKYEIEVNSETSEVFIISDKSSLSISYLLAMSVVLLAFIVIIFFSLKRFLNGKRLPS
ncbi:alpha-amylase family glycosyl hydrolase [Paenisporosarcina sp. TG-14]|uniref:alpha-amylase family glycosyl hydrolase n=1 Tax=Paenisporosarcina sp. TG-14 TaxID=1231057 RepID=UPI0003096FF2|nr:alpha-amylase family glycosyl hydrolase [Paenisporosarcina sp. TG-14]